MILGSDVPGATPIDDLSGLRQRHIQSRAELNEAEADNIRAAVIAYLIAQPTERSAPFDVGWFRDLHREMFGKVWDWAGRWRTSQTNVGVAPSAIEVSLHQLEGDLHAWGSSGMPMIEQSAHLHHRAVHIHPFVNGNGRWARMLANIWLRRHGQPIIEWPYTVMGTESAIRNEYLIAVRAGDAGDLGRLLDMHRRYQR